MDPNNRKIEDTDDHILENAEEDILERRFLAQAEYAESVFILN